MVDMGPFYLLRFPIQGPLPLFECVFRLMTQELMCILDIHCVLPSESRNLGASHLHGMYNAFQSFNGGIEGEDANIFCQLDSRVNFSGKSLPFGPNRRSIATRRFYTFF
jgi:hypothetical protein